MDEIQRLLFGKFPRMIGVTTPDWHVDGLVQYMIHSENEFDKIKDDIRGKRNFYASISAFEPVRVDGTYEGNTIYGDKVSFDFDSSAKASKKKREKFEDGNKPRWSNSLIPRRASDAYVLSMMDNEKEVREAVLRDCFDDAQRTVKACELLEIPTITIFTGFGFHLHLLYQPSRSRVEDKMRSITRKWISNLNLKTADPAASGRPFRIMRIPNIERICHEDRIPTGVFTIPLEARELLSKDIHEIYDLSHSPRELNAITSYSRPSMRVQEGWLGPGNTKDATQEEMRPVPKIAIGDSIAQYLIKQIVKMPCVYERAFANNPPNDVRVKLGIMLLNSGMSPERATYLISKLDWVDFDRDVTKYQLEKLLKNRKGDWSCNTMQYKGLCTRADDKRKCPTYGYKGGNTPIQL